MLLGASILKKFGPLLEGEGYDIIDLTVPGWSISPENVDQMLQRLKTIPICNNTVYILDLFGNSCTRVALFDGSTTLPIKGGGGFSPSWASVCLWRRYFLSSC